MPDDIELADADREATCQIADAIDLSYNTIAFDRILQEVAEIRAHAMATERARAVRLEKALREVKILTSDLPEDAGMMRSRANQARRLARAALGEN